MDWLNRYFSCCGKSGGGNDCTGKLSKDSVEEQKWIREEELQRLAEELRDLDLDEAEMNLEMARSQRYLSIQSQFPMLRPYHKKGSQGTLKSYRSNRSNRRFVELVASCFD